MVFIIAELGTNHMGDVKIAKKLIDVAVAADCNAVKLQKRNVEKIFTEKLDYMDGFKVLYSKIKKNGY